MSLFQILNSKGVPNNGDEVEHPSPALAVMILKEKPKKGDDPNVANMELTGTAVLFRNYNLALTAGHVHHSNSFRNSGFVYLPKIDEQEARLTKIVAAERHPKLDLKVLILENDVPVGFTKPEIFSDPAQDPLYIQGYGSSDIKIVPIPMPPPLPPFSIQKPYNPPPNPPVLAWIEGHKADPSVLGNTGLDLENHFVIRAEKTFTTDPGDSGSPVFSRKEPPFDECFGIFSRAVPCGKNFDLVFVTLNPKVLKWIAGVGADHGI